MTQGLPMQPKAAAWVNRVENGAWRQADHMARNGPAKKDTQQKGLGPDK
jgi:hypothetical protein